MPRQLFVMDIDLARTRPRQLVPDGTDMDTQYRSGTTRPGC
jgi:hypothetical protein